MATRLNPRATLAANVEMLMHVRGWNQTELAERAKVGQKTVSNILRQEKNTQIEIVDKIAAAFGLNMWHLIMPGLTEDLLQSGDLETVLNSYLAASKEGRDLIRAIATRESERSASNH